MRFIAQNAVILFYLYKTRLLQGYYCLVTASFRSNSHNHFIFLPKFSIIIKEMIKRKIIKHDVKKLFPELKRRLFKEEDIVFCYIFGSYGKGKVSPLSDVDIAVYLKTKKDLFERKIEILGIANEILKTDEVDLIILNEAPLSLIHSVFRTGKLLFSRDELLRVKFFAKNLKEYMEMGYYRERFWNSMKKRIKEGKFGF